MTYIDDLLFCIPKMGDSGFLMKHIINLNNYFKPAINVYSLASLSLSLFCVLFDVFNGFLFIKKNIYTLRCLIVLTIQVSARNCHCNQTAFNYSLSCFFVLFFFILSLFYQLFFFFLLTHTLSDKVVSG